MDVAFSLSWEAQQSAVACARLCLVLATLEPLVVPETGVFGTLQFALFSVSALAKQQSYCDASFLIKWIGRFVLTFHMMTAYINIKRWINSWVWLYLLRDFYQWKQEKLSYQYSESTKASGVLNRKQGAKIYSWTPKLRRVSQNYHSFPVLNAPVSSGEKPWFLPALGHASPIFSLSVRKQNVSEDMPWST